MSKPTVYLETSVISYLVSRPSNDIKVVSNQLATIEWWENRASSFDLYISNTVILEATRGDAEYSKKRLELIDGMPVLEITDEVLKLAEHLVDNVLPAKAYQDALHIAVSSVNGIDYVLTWNFKHIANAEMSYDIIRICHEAGFECPVLCSPSQLLGR